MSILGFHNDFSMNDYQQGISDAYHQLADQAGTPLVGTTVIDHALPIDLPPEAPLDAESLFLYLRTHLQDLDHQIRSQLNDMDGRRARLAQAGQSLTSLRALQQDSRVTHTDNDGHTSDDGIDLSGDGGQRFVQLMVDAGVSPADAQKIVDGWGHGESNRANADDIQSAIDAVNDRIGELNSSNDYAMLRINEVMNKRSQMVQMISKIMSSMDETARGVIGNMR